LIANAALKSISIMSLGKAVTFVLAVVLARLMGAESYGLYVYVVSIASLIGLFVQFGLPLLAVREVASAVASKSFERLNKFRAWSTKTLLVSSAVSVSLAISAFLLFKTSFDSKLTSTVFVVGLMIFVIAVFRLHSSFLKGLERVQISQLLEFLLQPLILLITLVIVAALYSINLDVEKVILVSLCSWLAVLAMCLCFVSYYWPASTAISEVAGSTAAWSTSAFKFMMLGSLTLINMQADLVLIGILSDYEQVGLYKVVSATAGFLVLGTSALNAVAAPKFARLYALKDAQELERVAAIVAWIGFAFAMCGLLTLGFFGSSLIPLVFGEEFAGGKLPLVILCAAQVVNAAIGSVGFMLNMTGNERDSMFAMLVAVLINVALNLVLIPKHGAVGAAMASATSIVFWNLLLFYKVRIRVGINTSIFQFVKFS
jgi:O-antigen/teichoic acid export membrane protein